MVKTLQQLGDTKADGADMEYGRTPLWWAAKGGHEGVAKLLLEREDINPNRADTECGRTPLSWAAEKGHEGVVEMMLKREDISPDTVDTKFGRTPLMGCRGWPYKSSDFALGKGRYKSPHYRHKIRTNAALVGCEEGAQGSGKGAVAEAGCQS